jgi:hypothetical protein
VEAVVHDGNRTVQVGVANIHDVQLVTEVVGHRSTVLEEVPSRNPQVHLRE